MSLHLVVCTSCRQPLGLATAAVGRIYCNEYCAEVPPVTDNEPRDALIAEAVAIGLNKGAIGEEVGISRQRVDQIASTRLAGAAT